MIYCEYKFLSFRQNFELLRFLALENQIKFWPIYLFNRLFFLITKKCAGSTSTSSLLLCFWLTLQRKILETSVSKTDQQKMSVARGRILTFVPECSIFRGFQMYKMFQKSGGTMNLHFA